MNNQTLAHVIFDRIESARDEMRRSRDEAAEAVLNAEDHKKACRIAYEADRYNEITKQEYNLAIREWRALAEAYETAFHACNVLTYGGNDLASRNSDSRWVAHLLAKAIEAAEQQAA